MAKGFYLLESRFEIHAKSPALANGSEKIGIATISRDKVYV